MNHTTLVMFGVLAAAAMLAGVSTVTFANAQTATRSGDFPIDQQVTLPDSLGQVSVSGTVHPPIPSTDLSSLPVGGQTQGLSNLGGLTGNLGGLTGILGGGTPQATSSSSGVTPQASP